MSKDEPEDTDAATLDPAAAIAGMAQAQSRASGAVQHAPAPKEFSRGPTVTTALRASSDGVPPPSVTPRRIETKAATPRREPGRQPEPTPAVDPSSPSRTPPPPIGAAPDPTKTAAATPGATSTPVQVVALPAPPPDLEVVGALLRSAAHLKVDAGVLGAVDLHLRLRDGALHLRVDGDAAHLVDARSGELTQALAREGLSLASIELPRPDGSALSGNTGDPQRDGRRQEWDEAANARESAERAPKSPPPGAKTTMVTRGSSIDVQA